MIIDMHCHIGRPGHGKGVSMRHAREITIHDVLTIQKEAGIDASVVLPMPQVYPADMVDANEKILTERHPSLFPFAWLNPCYIYPSYPRIPDGSAEHLIATMLTQKMAYGIKVHPVFDGYYPEPTLMRPIFQIARACKLPILWHTGWGAFGDPLFVELSAAEYPDIVFIIAHMIETSAPFVATGFPNVYLETSYCSGPERLAGAVRLIGSDRILFGSDFPCNDPIVQKTIVERAKISDTDKEKIFGINALRVLKLSERQKHTGDT